MTNQGFPVITSETRIIRRREVIHRVGVSGTTLWRMTRAGQFPLPVSLSPGSVGWHESEVDAWIASRPLTTVKANQATQ
jgi:prophage regulatory protein